jgi:zinc protease
MTLRLGNLDKLMNNNNAGSMTGQMLMMGSKMMDRQAIQDKLDELKARVYIGGGATGAFVSIETENEMLPAVIDFVGEVLRNPTFPEEEFEKMKKEQLAGIEGRRSDPQAIVFTEMQKRTNNFPKGHPYYSTDFDEDVAIIKAMTIDDVKKFYKDFYGASSATFSASGDMDKDAVIAALDRNFGNWKSPTEFKRIARPYRAVKPDMVRMETPDKANAVFVATQTMPISTDHPDYPALNMGNFILGGGFINSRLATRIRQKDGLSYGVGSQFNASDLDKTASFMAYAIYNPENREALEKAFREEIDRARKDGFTAEEVAAAKSSWVQSQQMNRAEDRNMAGTLGSNAYLGRTMEWSKELEEKVMSLTTEQINAAVVKYIDVDKMILLRAGDFERVEAKRP